MSYNSTAYNENYYKSHCGECYERGNGWEEIFAKQAEIIKRDFLPKKTLDIGCAAGYLVEGLRDRDVEAYGIDVSEYALSKVREDIKPFCTFHSATTPIESKYDLVTCIEVLEHLRNDEIKDAIHNMCQITDTIIFSSTPFDFGEETHFSVNQPGYWCAEFAANGFYHDVEYDCSYIAVQTMLFRRKEVSQTELINGYENKLFSLWNQCCILRDKNNISEARIGDLDRGNIKHAYEMQEYKNKVETEHAREMQVAEDKHARKMQAAEDELEAFEKKHIALMKMEYEKRDILECKFEIVKNEKNFLQQELQKCKSMVRKGNTEESYVRLSYAQVIRQVHAYRKRIRQLKRKPASYWKPVFNAKDYAEINQDVAEAVGNNERKLLFHFIEYGMQEGRRANKEFDIHVYMECNPDVTDHWKGDRMDCYLHYIENGKKEGRRAI
ncbi:MAG: class I SAM-dependent methyltransferase [Lachnospiraceae bacterium]